MTKIIKITDKTNSAFHTSPQDIAKEVVEQTKPGGSLEHIKKAVILLLDDEDGYYTIYRKNSRLKEEELIFLLDQAKFCLQKEWFS